MSNRWIEAEARGGSAFSAENSTWAERLAKYIPGEVLTAYLFLIPIAIGQTKDGSTQRTIALAAILFGLALIGVFYIARSAPAGTKAAHIWVGTFAFLVLTYSMGDFWADRGWYSELVASILVVFFALIAALVIPTKRDK